MNRIFAVTMVILAFQLMAFTQAQAGTNMYYYGTRNVQSKTYYVYLEEYSGQAELWFRVKKDACSAGDVKVLVVQRNKQTIDPKKTLVQAAQALCSVKGVYDNAKTAAGCGSTAITGVCLAASVPSGGTVAALCSTSIAYTVTKGFADCAMGIADWVGAKLAGDSDWAVIATQVSIASGQWASAIDYAIDYACIQVK
jgi:hypothetical protein